MSLPLPYVKSPNLPLKNILKKNSKKHNIQFIIIINNKFDNIIKLSEDELDVDSLTRYKQIVKTVFIKLIAMIGKTCATKG